MKKEIATGGSARRTNSASASRMRPVPLFVASARGGVESAAPLGALHDVPASRGHRVGAFVAAALAVALLVASIAVAVAPRAIVLGPVDVEPAITGLTARTAAEQLLAGTLALRERARRIDDLAAAKATTWMPLELEMVDGPIATLARGLRRMLRPDGPQIAIEVSAPGERMEILLREQPGNVSMRSRVARGPGSTEALLAHGSEDLLLLTTPLAAATLTIADPRMLADVSRLEELLSMLARDASAAQDPRTLLVRGVYEAANGRCAEALEAFDKVIAARPTAPRTYVHAADCHARMGNRDRALERLGLAVKQVSDTPLALSLAGQAYVRIGEPVRGLALLQSAHAREPALPGNSVAIGEALLALHRPAEALSWLSRHPAPEQARWLAATGLAQVRTSAGPAAEATAAALRALEPASVEVTRIEAELAAAMKAWPQALGRFGALRLAAPRDGWARAGEGLALLGMRRHEDAIEAYRACAEVTPWLAECRLGLGIALRESDRAEAALAPLAEAAKLDALDPRVPFETARTLRALLRRDEAAAFSARAELLSQRLSQRLALP
jgi:tetratricopeptide (TPR) repeat protein